MPPDSGPPFFVDRNLGRRKAVDALREAGFEAIAHDEKFGQQTPDHEWLAEAGKQGWLVISKDRRIRYRTDERDAFLEHGVRAVFITSGNMTGPALADLLRRVAPRLHEILSTAPKPAAFTLTKNGTIKPMTMGGNDSAGG